MIIDIDIDKLSQIFPDYIEKSIKKNKNKTSLVEIVIDLGRRPEGRFLSGSEFLTEQIVSWQDLDYATKRLGRFSQDNRTGIERTLHRISCIRNREGMIIGLTCRIGRCVLGSIGMIRDLLDSDESLLVLGKPGLGKTTLIREISRVLADEVQKRVVIVDTANEIAGGSDITHVGIGRARRMQASPFVNQHSVMIEAIENHMPEVIVVDEISTELEALAARTIAERGVKLVGTAHGHSLENLIKNPTLSDLIGGIHYVTLSDEEARKRGTQKTILERKSLPAFPFAVELNEKNLWTIHENVENSVDFLLRRQASKSQSRRIENKKLVRICHKNMAPSLVSFHPMTQFSKTFSSNKNIKAKALKTKFSFQKSLLKKKDLQSMNKPKPLLLNKVYIYSSCSTHQKQKTLFKGLNIAFYVTKALTKADAIIVSKLSLQRNLRLQKAAIASQTPIYLVKNNSLRQFKLVSNHIQKVYTRDLV